MKRSDLVLSLGQRLLLLLFIFILCYTITVGCIYVLSLIMKDNLAAVLRISAVLQDLFTFIVPAVVTALIVTKKPAELLCINSRPILKMILIITGILIVSIPAQEAIIYWNNNISFPEWMSAFAETARKMEDANFETMSLLLGNSSILALVVNLLIIGIAAGFSEELLFRGCFQRLLTTGGVNKHIAVWMVAICFSALHFQFFGFVPRMLLGAYFGYLLLWTRCIWVPVSAHILNNMMYVITSWIQVNEGNELSNEPQLWSLPATLISIVFTVGLLRLAWYVSVSLRTES